ncbi:MAG: peroxidase family protein [Pseudomonadota bacterium]
MRDDEFAAFDQLSKDIMAVQLAAKARGGALRLDRVMHAKPHLGVTDAQVTLRSDMPPDLVQGPWQPGARFAATLRLANGAGISQADAVPDFRAAALRLQLPEGVQDFVFETRSAHPARTARQFVATARAAQAPRGLRAWHLALALGPAEAARAMRALRPPSRLPASLATESFWTLGAHLWGAAGPVRLLLRPVPEAAAGPAPKVKDPNYLATELATRLAAADVVFELCVLRFQNQEKTPVEDASIAWSSASVDPIGRLTIPRQDITGADGQVTAAKVETLAFTPWHALDDFRPLGNFNRGLQPILHAAESHRNGTRFHEPVPMRNKVVIGTLSALFRVLNRRIEWFRFPDHIALFNLAMYRHQLRAENLIDRNTHPQVPQPHQPPAPIPEEVRYRRTFDGTMNDLSDPEMGRVGAVFGRNMPPDPRPELLHTPDPIRISEELLARKSFLPATSLNVLAAAWIQFQAHDWVQHARYPLGRKDLIVPMPEGRTWRNTPDGPEEREMRIAGDKSADETANLPITFPNKVSHWWDGSEVYGSNEDRAMSLLAGPRFRLDDGYLPQNISGQEVSGFNESWWLGLSIMHTLFAREHNAVVDELQRNYPDWDDMRLYHTARLVVSALIAKIHTVEWTPAILAHGAIDLALNANWSGPKDGLSWLGAWFADTHAMKGILDTLPDHHAAPYSLTEDFVTVYRLHPLLPDDFRLCDSMHGGLIEALKFDALQGRKTGDVMRRFGLQNTLYSFGTAHPGAIRLHNYPDALRHFTRDTAEGIERIDLSVVDIMRERSRGLPRYNKFREGLHKPPIRHWEDITQDPEDVRLLRDIYGSLDKVDTMVGLFSEAPPPGFGFSETSFRIFILMATRRIQSDRFLTVDYRPEIYSPLGIQWVAENTLTSVILRHFPDLATVIPRDQSAFAPWRVRAPV